MKRFLYLLIAGLLLTSCAAMKTAKKVDTQVKEDVDSTAIHDERIKSVIDTTKVSSTKVKITKIEFYDPARNQKEHHPERSKVDKEETIDDDDTPVHDQPVDVPDLVKKNLPNVKSIEITEIENDTKDSGVTEHETAVSDSSSVASTRDENTKTDEKNKPVDPYKWRWIFGILIVVGAIFFVLWLRFRKK